MDVNGILQELQKRRNDGIIKESPDYNKITREPKHEFHLPESLGYDIYQDDSHKALVLLGYLKQQLLKMVLDEYGTFEYLDPTDISEPEDPEKLGSIIEYNNIPYMNYISENDDTNSANLENPNVPIIWNILQTYTGVMHWEETLIDIDVTVTAGDWPSTVQAMGLWYETNVHTYQSSSGGKSGGGRRFYDCSIFPSGTRGVGDDCTSFCWACVQLYWDTMHAEHPESCDESIWEEVMNRTWAPASITWGDSSTQDAKNMARYGFEILSFSEGALQPYDMVMGSKARGCSHGHGEIFVTKTPKWRSYAWGNIHDKAHGGMPSGYCRCNYNLIFRIKS